MPGLEVAIVDDDGQIADDGSVGHIAVKLRTASSGLFHGYFRDPEGSARFSEGGIYRDTATRDSDGYFYSLAAPTISSRPPATVSALSRWKAP